MNSIKGFFEEKSMNMARSTICKSNPSKMKDRLRMALDFLPKKTVASMVKSSSFCQVNKQGGKRITRKQKKSSKKTNTRKH
jgi:hypothetical protein